MTMITPSYLGETIEYSSLHACRSTLEDPTAQTPRIGSIVPTIAPPLASNSERRDTRASNPTASSMPPIMRASLGMTPKPEAQSKSPGSTEQVQMTSRTLLIRRLLCLGLVDGSRRAKSGADRHAPSDVVKDDWKGRATRCLYAQPRFQNGDAHGAECHHATRHHGGVRILAVAGRTII